MAALASAKPALGCAVRPARVAARPVLAAQGVSFRRSVAATAAPAVARPVLPALRPRARTVSVVAQAASAPAPAAPAFKWGANMRDLAICVGVAVALWFAPAPAGVSLQAWHLLAVFVGTIVGIITTPLPLGAVAILGLGAAMLTKVLTFPQVSHLLARPPAPQRQFCLLQHAPEHA